jgi:DNA-directed RNA polymerase subunit RPC12/RpoP
MNEPSPIQKYNVCSRCRMPVDPQATRCPYCTSRIVTRDEVILTLGMVAFAAAGMVMYSYQFSIPSIVVAVLLCIAGSGLVGQFLINLMQRLRGQ